MRTAKLQNLPTISTKELVRRTHLETRNRNFLEDLRSPSNPKRYKRYTATPLRYAGGKTLGVGYVLEKIPPSVKRVVSPFMGGGSVEIAIANELNLPVIGYDIFDILVNFWQVQLKNPKALYNRLAKFKPTREEYKRVKEHLKAHWDDEKKLNKLDLAAHYYFNHNTSYGPHFLGWPSSVYLQAKRYKKMIEKVLEFRAPNLEVKCASFEEIMEKHRDDFLYLDPPYFLDGDSKTFVGMYPHRNFPIHHKGFRHDLLRDLLKKHRGGFILSYNDCSQGRDWYADYEMDSPEWQYTFSQGDTRIGANRKENNGGSHIKKSHELIIWSPPRN
ncbi:MAG: DNA adenine methylase [Rhodomicrobiaceae bacterium]